MPNSPDIYYFAHEVEDLIAKRPPIILVHGAGGNHLSWPPQIRRLPGARIYAVDLPGHGKSEGTGRQLIEGYAEDILAFMKSLKLRAAILAGISMGGAIALTLALKSPKKVAGLVLLGSGARMRVAPNILESLGNPNLIESTLDLVNENCFSANAASRVKELSKQAMMEIRPSVLLGDFIACNQFDVMDHLGGIACPTLIVCGAEDKMAPLKYSEALMDLIPGARLQVVDKAGHMVMTEQPEQVAGMLTEFIKSIPLRARR